MKRRACVLSLILPILAGAANIPQPLLPEGVGVNIHFVTGQAKDLDLIAAAGFRFVRMDFHWQATETSKGQYNWVGYDELLANLDQRGLGAILILDYSHPLYEETVTCPHPITGQPHQTTASPQHPASVAAFAHWAAAATKHFQGRRILWEIWNEPNGHFWSPKPDAQQYATLALATAKAIREADPQATIIGPASAGFPWEFLETFLKSGVLEYLGEDAQTDVILLYLEELQNGRALMEVARRITRGPNAKPILAIKSGRTPQGADAAASHTGSLAGEDAICDAVFRESGIVRVGSIEEAVVVLAEYGDEAKIIAGGQSLMPMLAFRMAAPKLLVDIGPIATLRRISVDDRGVTLGALVRWCDIERHVELSHAHPLLVEAIKHVAHYQIRNRGTVGGSLAHATWVLAMFAVKGHLDRLEQQGKIRPIAGAHPGKWQLA